MAIRRDMVPEEMIGDTGGDDENLSLKGIQLMKWYAPDALCREMGSLWYHQRLTSTTEDVASRVMPQPVAVADQSRLLHCGNVRQCAGRRMKNLMARWTIPLGPGNRAGRSKPNGIKSNLEKTKVTSALTTLTAAVRTELLSEERFPLLPDSYLNKIIDDEMLSIQY